MLSEARARLANTEGKKAKRKARERALDEARRLSTLQKRRELRAAGIVGKGRDKAKGIDYNAEIPFEKQPLPGFYDTSAEAAKTYEEPMRRTLLQMEPGPQPTDEEAKRKRDKAMNKPSRHEEALRRMQEADKVSKRRKLMLPHAQVSEADMEQIIKLGHAGEEARALVEHGESATEGLLGTYTPIERPAPDATPARAPVADALVREARELHGVAGHVALVVATPVVEELACRVVDGRDVVGVEGVAQAERVGQQADADRELAAVADPVVDEVKRIVGFWRA